MEGIVILKTLPGYMAMPLANGNYFYGTGSDATFTLDLETGERRQHGSLYGPVVQKALANGQRPGQLYRAY
jgi:hypothetical protein